MLIIRKLLIFFSFAFWVAGMSVSLEAQEGERIHAVVIQGNQRISEETILYYVKTKPDEPLSRNLIRRDIQEIHALGHFKDIQVETRETLQGLDVIFKVVELPSVGLLEVIGNDDIGSNEILEKIPIKRGATFRQYLLQEGRQEIKSLYNAKGYFFVAVDIDSKANEQNQIDVVIRINEGGKVDIEKFDFWVTGL